MMRRRILVSILLLVAVFWVPLRIANSQTSSSPALGGRVSSQEEGMMEGVLVSAKRAGSTITITVVTDAQGQYSFSQSRVYSAPTMKNATTVPTKIKSLTRSLLRLFTEPRVQPVHTQNQNNTDDNEFAHKTDITMSEL